MVCEIDMAISYWVYSNIPPSLKDNIHQLEHQSELPSKDETHKQGHVYGIQGLLKSGCCCPHAPQPTVQHSIPTTNWLDPWCLNLQHTMYIIKFLTPRVGQPPADPQLQRKPCKAITFAHILRAFWTWTAVRCTTIMFFTCESVGRCWPNPLKCVLLNKLQVMRQLHVLWLSVHFPQNFLGSRHTGNWFNASDVFFGV